MDADKIIMLEKGKIAEAGTHTELRQKVGGAYRKLVLSQLVEELPTDKKGDGEDDKEKDGSGSDKDSDGSGKEDSGKDSGSGDDDESSEPD